VRRIVLIGVLLLCCVLPAGASAADGDDRIVIQGPVLVDRDEKAGDVIVVNGDVVIRGDVSGDLVVLDGDATVRGTVGGDIVTFAGQAILGRRAVVDGDLVYFDKKPEVAEGAEVAGKTKKFNPDATPGLGFTLIAWLAISVSVLIAGLLLLLIAPKAADGVASAGKSKPLLSGLFGLLLFFALPIAAVVLFFTILGIPLGVGLLLAVLPVYALAYTLCAFAVGRVVVKKGARVLAFLAGLAILRVLAIIPIAGGIIGFLATLFGLGAIAVAIGRARS